MSRLVVVSNRVILPSERIQRAGGLAVAIREALGRSGGLWFGWSGELSDSPAPTCQTASKGKMDFAVFDLDALGVRRLLQPVRQLARCGRCSTTASAWSSSRAQPSRPISRSMAASRRC